MEYPECYKDISYRRVNGSGFQYEIKEKIFEAITSHDLRRSGVRYYREKGVSNDVIRENTGHKDNAILEKSYFASLDNIVSKFEEVRKALGLD